MAGRNLDITSKFSKKIAELTVVVHMLFKRNHEKEVEYEFFKLISEQERKKLKEDSAVKIAWLEQQLEEQEAYRAKIEYELGDLKNLQEKISTLEELNKELKEQLDSKDETLMVANIEIEDLKEKNENLMKELAMTNKTENVIENDEEEDNNNDEILIKALEEKLSELKLNHKDEMTLLYAEKVMLQKKVDNYNSAFSQELEELKDTLDILSSKQIEDQRRINEVEIDKKELEQSLRKAEEEKRNVQKKMQLLKDQLHLVLKNNNNQKSKTNINDGIMQQRPNRDLYETRDEELARLRHEVRLYRMELKNREGNFNRMFADQQPVILKTQSESHLVERNLTGTRIGKRQHLPRLTDGRSMTFMSGIKRTSFL